jgi:hypothetical protein
MAKATVEKMKVGQRRGEIQRGLAIGGGKMPRDREKWCAVAALG